MADGFDALSRTAPVPKMVQDFVVYFYRHIRERNIREIFVMYSHTFPHLSERFFKGVAWPPVEAVSHLVDNDHVFCMLYKEMCFRHLHAAAKPTLAHRIASWENYREFFSVILSSHLNVQLPNQWLWDMVDEFVYQYQAFAQYRGNLSGKSIEELDVLAASPKVWDSQTVLQILNDLVSQSDIRGILSKPGGAEALYVGEGYDLQSNVQTMLGYFSLVGLLRVHSVLGDYVAGLQALAPLNPFNRRHLFTTKIAMSNITLFYYSAFAYLMLQRYLDAAKCLNFILGYISKVKAHHQRGPGYDQILKKNEQLYALLAISSALCPAVSRLVDENVQVLLREKYGEKVRLMNSGQPDAYEELFAYACPKFVSRRFVDPANPQGNANMEAYKPQLNQFLSVVEAQRHLPALKQFLRLYTSITLSKLASLAELDEASLRAQLALMHASTQVVTWNGGDALAGTPQPAGDLDFALERGEDGQEMVVVQESRAAGASGSAFLVSHIQKLQDIVTELEGIVLAPAPGASAPAVAAN
ncbi:hypothetical protein ACKKBF_B34645 [Auxenochlorella protothecoides x Auxenochlorella symbiontica]|uniref:Eukaryotic translation initiation factor 3 subunit L n=2 Tax=Auxenochlorella protothecoides TaxID=3075 RepID=A0A1D1ZRS9_AUXPR